MDSFQDVYCVYGTKTKVDWIKSHISYDEKIVDLGCGTGWSITIPLIQQKYNVYGFDLCSKSIELGIQYAHDLQITDTRLFCRDFALVHFEPQTIIMAEVLEHLQDQEIEGLIKVISEKIAPGGKLLVTVPHGYGWFEIENFIYTKLGIKTLFKFFKIEDFVVILKNKIVGFNTVSDKVSSVDSSPHVQKFTYYSFDKRLEKFGFYLVEKKGGVFLCGPISNTFLSGFKIVQKINVWLGNKMPWIAADLYFCFQKK